MPLRWTGSDGRESSSTTSGRPRATPSPSIASTSTNGVGLLALISGPIAKKLGINSSTVFDALTKIEQDDVTNLVIDLRYNTGGNFFNILPFACGIGYVLPPHGRIFLLANRGTFSAAIVTMALVKHHAGADRVNDLIGAEADAGRERHL